jgi:ABC-2 type transport system permease protein
MGVKGLVNFIVAYFRVNIQAAMEYRFNFIILTFGMFINDVAWIIFWWIIFAKFNTIGGWSFNNLLAMYSIITIAFGLATFFVGNWQRISENIIKGRLDYYMVLPKPLLLHMLVSRSEFSGMGDFLFGVVVGVLAFLAGSISSMPFFVLLVAMSTLILISFGIVIGSLTFFAGGTGEFQDTALGGIVALSTYPFTVFGGLVRILLLTAIPVGFLTGIPVLLLQHYSATYMIYMIVATVLSVIVATLVFYTGLKRYESGNLINAQI